MNHYKKQERKRKRDGKSFLKSQQKGNAWTQSWFSKSLGFHAQHHSNTVGTSALCRQKVAGKWLTGTGIPRGSHWAAGVGNCAGKRKSLSSQKATKLHACWRDSSGYFQANKKQLCVRCCAHLSSSTILTAAEKLGREKAALRRAIRKLYWILPAIKLFPVLSQKQTWQIGILALPYC